MQSNANIPFSFGGSDLAAQTALMQSLNMSGQNQVPGNQGFSMLDQSMTGNMQNPQSGFSMNNINPMLLQQSMGSQLQGYNIPQNSMPSQMPFQMQQQMMGGNDQQFQQMSLSGMNPQALIAQMQSAQLQNGCGITDAMTMAIQGLMNAQRTQMGGQSGRENSNSNNTVLLGGNQRFQSNQNLEGGALRLNTVYVSNLPQNVDHEMIKREFNKVGSIKLNSKSGMPMIWIFKDRGVPRGDALVTYENNSSASNAVMYFQENDFDGCRIEVRIATNLERPIIAPPNNQGGGGGGGNKNFNFNDKRGGNQFNIESISRQNNFNSGYDWNKNNNDSGHNRQKDFRNKSNDRNRGPDWICAKCSNNNFSWRDSCNRCQEPKSDSGEQKMDRNRNFNQNRPNNKTLNRPNNNRAQDGGPMRGQKRSNSRPGPY